MGSKQKQHPLERLGVHPEVVHCPICDQTGKTRVSTRRNTHQTLICGLIGFVSCIWCLPCVFKAKKGTTQYCSNCGVRLAYRPEGHAAITPSYLHDKDRLVASQGYTSQPKIGKDIETAEKSHNSSVGSPLGIPASASNDKLKRKFHDIRLIPTPLKQGSEAEGLWKVESADARFKDYKITVDECPPRSDDTTDATPRYCDKVLAWKSRSGHSDPEIQIERTGLESRVCSRIRRISAHKDTKWRFDVTANRRNFDFTPPSHEPSRETTEWASQDGPLFWQTPGWYTTELLDAYGRVCATYTAAATSRGIPMMLSITDGVALEVVDEMLVVAISMQVQKAKQQEWGHATWKDDDQNAWFEDDLKERCDVIPLNVLLSGQELSDRPGDLIQ